MESIILRPEKEQKTMWVIGWAIPFVLGLALWMFLLPVMGKLFFGFCLAGWLMLMLPILLWIPAFYNSLEYVIDSDSIKTKQGLFWKKQVTVPYKKITNIDITQGPLQRRFNIGIIHVQTPGAAGPQGGPAELKLLGVRDLAGLKDVIMERVRNNTFSKAEAGKNDIAEESSPEIFRCMLKELSAIRETLEKKCV